MRVDLAIVGAGPAGCAAAVQARRLGLSVTLCDRSGLAGGLVNNAWRIENEPATGGPIDGREYVRRLRRALEELDVPVLETSIHAVEPGFLLRGEPHSLAARAVVLATGTEPKRAGLPNEGELAGSRLFYEVLPALRRTPERALVVGGGEAAFDYALSLAKSGARVDLAVRSTSHRANRRLADAVAATPAITVLLGTRVEQLEATDAGCCVGLRKQGQALTSTVDAVVVAVGRTPALPALLSSGVHGEQIDLLQDGAQLTIADGLVIAGDARLGSLGQSGIAVGDGLHAAQLAAEYIRGRGGRR